MNDIKIVRSFLLIVLFFATGGLAVANDLNGSWAGTGQGIYANGVTEKGVFSGSALQVESTGLFSAVLTFSFPSGEERVYASGHVDKNGRFTGVLSLTPDPTNAISFALIDGKVSGNKITGTARNLFDGSTTVMSGRRVR